MTTEKNRLLAAVAERVKQSNWSRGDTQLHSGHISASLHTMTSTSSSGVEAAETTTSATTTTRGGQGRSSSNSPNSSSRPRYGGGGGRRVSAWKHDTEVVQALKRHGPGRMPSTRYDLEELQRRYDYGSLSGSTDEDKGEGAEAGAGEQQPRKQESLADEQVGGLSAYEDELRSRLSKAVFVGHVNTDLDSVAGAIGAAALFGGTPALAESCADDLNGEIQFALRHCDIEPPTPFDKVPRKETCPVCLVDHTEEKQMVPALRNSSNLYTAGRIVGVIDHHALAASFKTSIPIFMDVRPWGSMSTIVGYLFVVYRRNLPKNVAVLLLQAILSDTLNLRSVTTTNADRSMVALLSAYGGITSHPVRNDHRLLTTEGGADDIDGRGSTGADEPSSLYKETEIDLLAKRQFQAKTDWIVSLGAYEMVRGDQKDFTCGDWKFGISVLEVTSTDVILEKMAGEILLELRLLKKEKGTTSTVGGDDDGGNAGGKKKSKKRHDRAKELDFAFLFVVNVVEQTSILLIAGGRELCLAKAAFMPDSTDEDEQKQAPPNEDVADADADASLPRLFKANDSIRAPGSTIRPEETAMALPKGYVSRKAQFVPAFFKAIENDYFHYEPKGLPVSLYFIQEGDEEEEEEGDEEVYDDYDYVEPQDSKEEEEGPPPTTSARHRSSLRSSIASLRVGRDGNSCSGGVDVIEMEKLFEEELLHEEKQRFEKNHGNMYNDLGRVVRSYDNGNVN